jgi:phospholipid/cholesterol/gamma-HCH transport system ATP-binding protein
MIAFNNICKSFGENAVLKDISSQFEKGRINMIIGDRGSRKTVLMKCLIGLHEPDSGKIYYNEREFTSMSYEERKEVRKEMGMLFQGCALFDSLTVKETVGFALEIFPNKTKEEIAERVNFCLMRVNLSNFNHLFPAELSGGMKKRVGIARAIALNPRYLCVDEPNSGLDPRTASVIDNLIKEITVEFDITTVVNTHDMNSVFEIGESIIFLHNGQKWWEGNPHDIQDSGNKELVEFVFSSAFVRHKHGS